MDVFVANEHVRLTDADLLGEGGEARVYRWKGLALKVFHAPSAQKAAKLRLFPTGLPGEVVAPLQLVTDRRGSVLGYAMNAVSGAADFGRLASRKRRLGNAEVTRLFARLQHVVSALHQRLVIVGDFNDGNVLFAGAEPYLIDVDSMQFAGLPCAVGHEKFLDPRLYGVDLTVGPRFTEGSDWYSFAVMLFSSLLYVHPFGGTHAKLGTLLRRAEARHSVFKPDVIWPRLAASLKILPDDVSHWFSVVFDRDERSVPPAAVTAMQWSKCACGSEHARAVCPECHALGVPLVRQVLRAKGRCTARTAFQTSGRILAAAMQGGLRYAYEENGVVRREDGSEVGSSNATTSWAVSGATTWSVAANGSVERIEKGKVSERLQTQVRGGTPVFSSSSSSAYRQEHEWLVDVNTGSRVGQVLEGQTWLWSGERLSLGFYRAGGFTNAFLLRAGRAGLVQLVPPRWVGRIVEAEAVFDAHHALLTVVIDADGKETVQRSLYSETGALIASCIGGSKGHAALMGGKVIIATDGGLVLLKTDSGVLLEAMQFTDTQPFVSAGDELLPQPDGSLFVVGPRDITQLTLT